MGLIPSYSLLEPQRVSRPPLRDWAGEIVTTMRALRHQMRERPSDIAACMNLAALIEASRGNLETAEELCNDQLCWIANMLRNSNDQSIYVLALQPWVNLGRLFRIRGRLLPSLERFSLLLACTEGKTVSLGPVHINSHIWSEIRERNPEATSVLATVFILDSLKAFFSVRQYDSALDFVNQHQNGCAKILQPYFSEAKIVALAEKGSYETAQQVLSSLVQGNLYAWGTDLYAQLVLASYQAVVYAAAGDVDRARPLAAKMGGLASAARVGEGSDPKELRFLEHLGSVNEHLKSNEVASALYRTGYSASLRLGDQPFQLSFLDAIMQVQDCQDFAQLNQKRSDILRDYLYVDALGKRTLAAEMTSVDTSPFDALIAEVREFAFGPGNIDL